jgi:polyisoprenoid-binding protein YceI
MKTRLVIFSVFFFVHQVITAQSQVQLLPASSSFTIQGTSSLHDWEEKLGKFNVDLSLKMKEKDVATIEKANFICKSASIESESSLMTKKTLEALKAEKYPEISFTLISVDKLVSQNGSFSGTVTGDIKLAGVTKRISIPFSGNNVNNQITLKGSKTLSLAEYQITPPTAMMGTLKTGDKVTVAFNLQFQVK